MGRVDRECATEHRDQCLGQSDNLGCSDNDEWGSLIRYSYRNEPGVAGPECVNTPPRRRDAGNMRGTSAALHPRDRLSARHDVRDFADHQTRISVVNPITNL